MNEIIQSLKANATNGKENFCFISEKQLNAMKELSKRETKENQQLQERIEYLERSNNRREDTILEQRQRLSDLEDNWNKLKDYIVKEYYMYLPLEASAKSITILIDKMKELEQGSDSNE